MSIEAVTGALSQLAQGPSAGGAASVGRASALGQSSFEDQLSSMLEQVDGAQHAGDVALQDMAAGEAGIHETMIALTQADITLQAASTARNKVVSAYETIMNMAI